MDFDWPSFVATGDANKDEARQNDMTSRQHHLTASSRDTLSALGSSYVPSRPPRPSSSASFLSIASSPGPMRHHSSPPQELRAPSRRPRSTKADLDVKVLYTLDSHPNSTLVAHLGRVVPVQVVSFGKKSDKRRSVAFGKVTLKTCLGAICMASPELTMENKQDYILYSVDPIEAYRSSQRSGSGAAPFASTSTLPAEASGSLIDRDGSKTKSSAFVVGKGFFSWAMSEQGDGQTIVSGRIRDEYAEDGDENLFMMNDGDGNEGDLSGKVLEVSLRLKAAPSITREQYVDRMNAIQSIASSMKPASTLANVVESLKPSRSKRKAEADYDRTHPQSASSPVTATEKEQSKAAVAINSNTAQQQLLHILQALQAASASSPQDTTNSLNDQQSVQQQQQSTLPQAVDQLRQQQKSGNSPDVMSNLLRNLAAPPPSASSSKSPNVGGNAALIGRPASTTPRQSTSKGMSLKSSASSTASPILGGLTPGYEADYISGPSPDTNTKATAPSAAPSEGPKMKREIMEDYTSLSRSTAATRSKQCCYNCGIKAQRSWRHLPLKKGDSVPFEQGSIVFDHGKKLHRACNACGLYYNKYGGIHRPEHVWKEAHRVRLEQQSKNHEDKFHGGAKCDCTDRGEDDSAMEDAASISNTFSRTKQLARTLSEVCERDSTRRLSIGEGADEEFDLDLLSEKAPARKVDNFAVARLKDLVQDRDGLWRSKRSILENPSNKRPGRPKGSKTGKGTGRGREEKLKKKRLEEKQYELLLALEEGKASGSDLTSASSPGGATKHATFDVNGIHSSPMRSSSTFGQTAKTPGSAVSRVRYGAASYLLDSSPATAFQTVLNEAETDWNTLCGLSPRRSPRKHPQGTLSGLNPYATVNASPSRTLMDSKQQLPSGNLSTHDLLKMTSSSPLTRSRVKSGQYHFDDAWFSSEGLDFGFTDEGGKKTGSSSMTSPGSPSPSPAHLKKRGAKRKIQEETMMLQPGQRPAAKKRGKGASQQEIVDPSVAEEQARKAARQARQAASAVGASESNAMDAGPFMGLDLVESMSGHHSAIEDEEEEAGGGSPTLGRSRRMDRKRSANEELAGSLSVHPSPPTAMLDFSQDWTRSASMQELFPTPSPIKQWTNINANSPSNALWQSPTSWGLKGANPSPSKTINERALMPVDMNQQQQPSQGAKEMQPSSQVSTEQQLVRRKPLPATVEDASSSVNSATSTPRDEEEEEDSFEEGNAANLMDLFEDPYGLLAASGIGGQGSQPGMSMEDFGSIELFKNVDFTQQLEYFTQMGSNGVAAHIAPDQGASSSTLKIEGKSRNVEMENLAGDETITPGHSTATQIDFDTLLKDPAMQALLAHMQQSPSKQRPALMPSMNEKSCI